MGEGAKPTKRFCHHFECLFYYYGVVTITGEELQILTYAQQSWPLSSEGSLACHIYCNTGHPFIMVISEDPHLMPSFSSGAVTTCFYDLCLSGLGFEHPTWQKEAGVGSLALPSTPLPLFWHLCLEHRKNTNFKCKVIHHPSTSVLNYLQKYNSIKKKYFKIK